MKNAKKTNKVKNISPYLVLFIIIGIMIIVVNLQGDSVHDLTTGKLIASLKENKVTEITITPNSEDSVYYIEGKLEGYDDDESFKSKVVEEELSTITEYIQENDIDEYDTNKDPGSSTIMYIIVNVVPFALLILTHIFVLPNFDPIK